MSDRCLRVVGQVRRVGALGRIGPQEVGADGGVRTVPVISECAAASRGVWGSVGRVGRVGCVGRVGVSEFDTIDTRYDTTRASHLSELPVWSV